MAFAYKTKKGIESNMINVFFGLSNEFAKYCATTIASILVNHEKSSSKEKIHFFLLGNLTQKNKDTILKLKKIQDFDCSFISANTPELKKIPLNGMNLATLYKLLSIEALPGNVDKVIALDSDMVFNDDISKLWNINIDDYYLAAVKDADISKEYKNYKETYFNAGVMVINIKKLKEAGFSKKWKDFVNNEKNTRELKFCEQDIFNILITDKVYFLPNIYNMSRGHCLASSKEIIENTIVAHFAGNKPWQPTCIHPLKDLYFKYEAFSPSKRSKTRHYAEYFLGFMIKKPLFLFKKGFYGKLKNFIFKKQ